jgi:hypothetical protein
VEDSHSSKCKDNHRALEDHEGSLIVGKVAAESFPQLGNAVYATDENENSGNEETYAD